MPRPLDIWRCAIVKQTAEEIVRDGVSPGSAIWFPDTPPFTFWADPFALWRDGRLYVFAEAFDYRTGSAILICSFTMAISNFSKPGRF